MKKIFLAFAVILILFGCNKDDDNTEPLDPLDDLSFPECLLSNDIAEYQLIMENEPTETRSRLIKKKYNFKNYYFFHISEQGTDFDVVYYDNNCEVYCTLGLVCPLDFTYADEKIGIVWTDPR